MVIDQWILSSLERVAAGTYKKLHPERCHGAQKTPAPLEVEKLQGDCC